MDELTEHKEIKKFNKWRKTINKTLPDIASRVFALRKKFYAGCGFHWGFEKELGWIISSINDFDKSYRNFEDRVIVEVRYDFLIKKLKKIENEKSIQQ